MFQQEIKMIRGRTQAFALVVTDVDGSPYTLADGEVLRFGVKHMALSQDCLLVKELTAADAVDGSYVLTLTPEDTAGLPVGHHVYDVGLQSGSHYFTIIEPSDFWLMANVTEKEA